MSVKKLKELPGYQGHGESSMPPSPRKGTFYGIGTWLDAGAMNSTFPKGTSPNVKTGTSSGQEQ